VAIPARVGSTAAPRHQVLTLTTLIQFAVLGLGAGAAYGLLALGIVAVYRATGVLNFAQAAFAMFAAFLFVDFHYDRGWPAVVALLAAIGVNVVVALLAYVAIFRPLRHASNLVSVMATLGILTVLNAAVTLHYGALPRLIGPWLPHDAKIIGGVSVPMDRVWIAGGLVVATVVLVVVTRYTRFGLATTAVSENEVAASSLGCSPNVVGAASWAISAALAAVAGALLVPISGLQTSAFTALIIPALAAALLGRLVSYQLAAAGGVAIGMAESIIGTPSLVGSIAGITGVVTAVPFLVIVVFLVVRGTSIPTRGFVGQRLPSLGTGDIRWGRALIGLVAVITVVQLLLSAEWQDGMMVSAYGALLVLSLVVLTGLAGQISLAQYTLAGVCALIAGHVVQHWPLALAIPIGLVAAVLVGLLFALPALRTRGPTLAVVTLGLAVAVQAMVFNNDDYIGGFAGLKVGSPNLFGIDLDPRRHPDRYATFAIILLFIALVAVANLRRGVGGRALIALRGNERAAAAIGINVTRAKLWAFAISAAIAGLAGIIIGFRSQYITFEDTFAPLHSVEVVSLAVVGGIGWVIGPLFSGPATTGGLFTVGLRRWGDLDQWLVLFLGVGLILALLLNPDGLAQVNTHLKDRIMRRFRRRSTRAERRVAALLADADEPDRVVRRTRLQVNGLRVRFGGVHAVDDLDLTVESGQVIGLIGPNGAGKTTAIDAITGFVHVAAGSVTVDDVELTRTPVHRRARRVGRSFQGVELFEDISVLENLQVACDHRGRFCYLRSLFGRERVRLSAGARFAIEQLDLQGDLANKPTALAQGRRRLVGIARCVAAEPDILLLDEPAAGMSKVETADLRAFIRALADDWGFAVLLVDHDMGLVMEVCDRITVLSAGRRIAEGPPRAIRADPLVIAAYLGDDATAPVAPVVAEAPATSLS
jgi:ABC-type branched-subunit amino acid transport system ATPase component/ABC-type branched-subunit amino acid transport system permease subunit